MNEVEKKDVTKWKAGFVLAVVLVSTFGILNLWLYMKCSSLRTQVANLQSSVIIKQVEVNNLGIRRNKLLNQLSLLNITYQNYVSTHRYTNSEYDSYVDDHLSYVQDHLYTNSEYDEACLSFYYVKPEEQKFGVFNLDDELDGLEWTEPYQAGVFDCSEMSACLEWFLENKGWHVKIYQGDSPFGSGTHAWLIVETSEGKYMPVESTTLSVVLWSDPNFDNYWIYDKKFETIQDAIDYSESGFDWWELGFSPLQD